MYTPVAVFDPYKYTNADMLRVHGITYETLMEDEMNQIHGYIHFADGAGVGFHYLTLFTPKEAARIVKNGEVSFCNKTNCKTPWFLGYRASKCELQDHNNKKLSDSLKSVLCLPYFLPKDKLLLVLYHATAADKLFWDSWVKESRK